MIALMFAMKVSWTMAALAPAAMAIGTAIAWFRDRTPGPACLMLTMAAFFLAMGMSAAVFIWGAL